MTETPKAAQKKIWNRLIAVISILCFVLVIAIILKLKGADLLQIIKNADEPYMVNATQEDGAGSINDILSEAEQVHEQSAETQTDEDEETEDAKEDSYATPHKGPLTDDSVKLSDIYAVSKSAVTLKCYYPEAVSYTWQRYDMKIKDWEDMTQEEMTDELFRTVSSVDVMAPENQDDAIMVRCTAMLENGENITDEATVYSIADIAGISVASNGEDEGYTTNCGEWLYSQSIPVKVTFADGSTKELTGLAGLTFVDRMESSENSYTNNGNAVETVTIINTECEYSYIDAGEKELLLRYRNGDKQYEAGITVTGKDLQPPQIADVHISEFDIKNVDEPVTVSVAIEADDNDTPYPYLQYAFLPDGTEPNEDDWTTKSSFGKDITKNGIWIAYCKDRSGNVGTFKKEIIAVDEKPPVMTVSLENNDWCPSNKIIVEAKDGLPILYSFSCEETGEESGWTDRSEYDVTRNGTWKVRAKDSVGNTTEQDITITNIDTQMPVIRGITEGEHNNDETQ